VTDPLFQFQTVMRDFLVARDRGFMAADMGLGKTRVAIEAAGVRGFKRKLVVAPAIGLVSWPGELSKWSDEACLAVSDPALLPDSTSESLWAIAPFSEVQRNPRAWVEAAHRFRADLTVIDEAHYAKEQSSARAQALYGWRMDLKNSICLPEQSIWPMSGTPAPNYTSELWTHLHALAPVSITSPRTRQPMSYQEFLERFAVTRTSSYGQHVTGSRNTEQLRLATNSFFHRIRKTEARPDMPPILWTAEPIPAGNVPELNVPEGISDENLVAYLDTAFPSGSSERKAVGLAKVPGVVEWARAFLAGSDRKLIIFAWHRDVVRQITRALGPEFGAVSIDGDTSLALRNAAVSSFQLPAGPRVFVGQMLACGTMLTLTAASDVAFAEDDWTPGTMEQAAARADRLGQLRGVRAVILHAPTKKDKRIARVRVDKANGLELMFGQDKIKEEQWKAFRRSPEK